MQARAEQQHANPANLNTGSSLRESELKSPHSDNLSQLLTKCKL